VKRRLAVLALLLALLVACATLAGPAVQPAAPPPTLRITNNGPYDFAVMLASRRIGSSMAGTISCIRLTQLATTGPHYIGLRGLAARSLIVAPGESLQLSPGWIMTVGAVPSLEVYSLAPGDSCDV
jgi:hypothetical protein